MGPDYQPQDRSRRFIGLAVVALLHVFVIWGLMSGLARKAIEVIKKPIEVAIVDEPRPVDPVPPPRAPPRAPPPPPSPSPPRVIDRPPPPTPAAPAPTPAPVVTAPEIVVPAAAPAPPIQVTQERAPEKPAETREAAPVPPASPAVTVPSTRSTPHTEVERACPGYQNILNSALAKEWERVGITGAVTVLIHIRGNQIVDVTPESGPREYFRRVQRAVMRFKCTVQGADEDYVHLTIGFREPPP